MLLLVFHLLLGFRRLRDWDYYQDDPLVKRLLGLKRLPDVSTVSRSLRSIDIPAKQKVREVGRDLVIARLQKITLYRVTLDFDGSVLSTLQRRAEGTAVGSNKRKKGARSYYPLFCTITQTGQVLDVLFRSGNVHDSNGARDFIEQCRRLMKEALPGVTIETRLDSAFFNDEIVTLLEEQGVEFSLSVPFERFAEGYDFKVIVTNKRIKAKKVLMFPNGRADQEGLFGELKSQTHMDYIPVGRWAGNQLYTLAATMAHNLTREIQMAVRPKKRGTTEKRSPLWCFEEMKTLGHLI